MKTRSTFKLLDSASEFIFLMIFLATYLLISAGYAQFSPAAEKILNHYVQVTGGPDAYAEIENRVTESEVTVEGSNICLNITVTAQKPNLVRMITESPATGKVISGCDGETVWELSEMKGPLIKLGNEKKNSLHLNILDRLADWEEVFREAEYRGLKDINGQRYFTVYVEPYEADPQLLYFDRGTKLLVALETTMKSNMGDLPIISYFDDYREVDGIKLPFETRVHVASQVMISRIKNIQHNVDLDENIFALPEEIQALIDQQG